MTALADDGCSIATGPAEVVAAVSLVVVLACASTVRRSTAAGVGVMRGGNVGGRWTGDAEEVAAAVGFRRAVSTPSDRAPDPPDTSLRGAVGVGVGAGCRAALRLLAANPSPGARSRELTCRGSRPPFSADDRRGWPAASGAGGAEGCAAAEADDDEREINTTTAMNPPIISTKSRNPMRTPSEGGMLTADE